MRASSSTDGQIPCRSATACPPPTAWAPLCCRLWSWPVAGLRYWKPCTATPPLRNTSCSHFLHVKRQSDRMKPQEAGFCGELSKSIKSPWRRKCSCLSRLLCCSQSPVSQCVSCRFGCVAARRLFDAEIQCLHPCIVEMKKCTPVKCSNVSRSFTWKTGPCAYYKRIKSQFLSHLVSWSSQIEFSGIRGLLPM